MWLSLKDIRTNIYDGQEPTESSSPGQQSITDRPPEPRTRRRIIINGWGDKTGSKNTRSLTQLIKITSSLTTRARSQYAVPLLGFYTTSQPMFEQFWPFHSLVRHSSADKCLTLVILYYSIRYSWASEESSHAHPSILGNQRFLSSVSPSWIIFGGGHIGTWGCMLAAPIPDRNIFALWQENPIQQLNTAKVRI